MSKTETCSCGHIYARNKDYIRFESTYGDLEDCFWNWDEEPSNSENYWRSKLLELCESVVQLHGSRKARLRYIRGIPMLRDTFSIPHVFKNTDVHLKKLMGGDEE